jgi:hypothetical protein
VDSRIPTGIDMRRPRNAVECNCDVCLDRFPFLRYYSTERSHNRDLESAAWRKRCDPSGLVKRSGIGASAVTAVVFSVFLISNFTVFMAAQDRQKLYIQSEAEDSLSNGALVLAGVGATNLLGRTQDFLAATAFNCATALESSANLIAGLSDIEQNDRITVVTSAALAPSANADDNMSMVKPYNGSLGGDVDIVLGVRASGSYASAGVSLERTESHLVHLPVRLEAAASVCAAGVEMLRGFLEGSRPSNCTSSALGPILSEASAGPSSMAASAGFGFGVRYAIDDSRGCAVYFNVYISQDGIDGPHGSFSVRMQQAGLAYLRQVVPLPA